MNPLNILIVALSLLTTITQAFPFPFPKEKEVAKRNAKVLPASVNKFVANRTWSTENVTGLIYTSNNTRTNGTNSSSLFIYPLGLNVTNVTLPELTSVSDYFNTSTDSSHVTSLVIASSNKSLGATGFYFAIAYPNETVVVAENVSAGLIVANSSKSADRGTLIVDCKRFIYSAISYPMCPIGYITAWDQVVFYYEPSLISILKPSSPLYTNKNFTHFNSSQVTSNISSSEPVPIIYSSTWNKKNSTNSSSSSVQWTNSPAVVVEVANTTAAMDFKWPSVWSPNTIVIFASNGSGFIDQSEFSLNSTHSNSTVAAGFLNPVQASILASFAISAGLTSLRDLMSILPGFD